MSRVELHIFPVGNATGTPAGGVRCVANKWKFQDKMMGEQFITFNITSEKPIDWAVGDYCIFRDETYTLNYIPTVIQKARTGERQDSYTYENVKFESRFEELTRCTMLDIIPTSALHLALLGTNYTGSSKFQLYCGEKTIASGSAAGTYTPVCTLALKMQANLDRMYGSGVWTIDVDTTTSYTNASGNTQLVTHTDEKTLSFDNTTVAKALEEVHNTFKLDYCVKGRTILIGHTLKNLTSDNDSNAFAFGYGKGYPTRDDMGTGLFKLKRVANSQQKIVTRLRAIGSTKNMPYRHYHSRYSLSQAMFPTNLQLPNTFDEPEAKAEANAERDELYGVNELNNLPYVRHVKGDTNDAYIDKDDDAEGCVEGVREDSVRFDGSNSDLPEIYPTIEEVTYGDLRGNRVQDQAGISDPQSSFDGYDNDERVDELLAIGYKSGDVMIDDANIGNGILTEEGGIMLGGKHTCEISETVVGYNDLSAQSDVGFVGPEKKLFEIRDVYPGKYALVPTANSVFYGARLDNYYTEGGIRMNQVNFIFTVKQRSKATGATTILYSYRIPRWCSVNDGWIIDLHEDDGLPVERYRWYFEKEMPTLPTDAVEKLVVSEFSDIIVTITPVLARVANAGVTMSNLLLTYWVGSSKKENTGLAPEYNFVSESSSSSNDSCFHVFIKDMGFDITACFTNDTPVLAMKSGNCVSKEFEICSNVEKVTYNDKRGYMLTLKRKQDDGLNTYFPSSTDSIAAGDKFVLLNINMPNAYIEAAESRLLRAATDYLADNCETKFTYQPSIDDIYLQRNYDICCKANHKEDSIFWRLYAGLKFTFIARFSSGNDEVGDELMTAELTIEQVSIQMGDGLTPKVEIRLNDDVQQSTLQKLTTSIDRIYSGSIFGAGSGGGGGVSTAQLLSLIQDEGSKQFISKRHDDIARGVIGFLSGLWVSAKGLFGFDEEGNVTASSLKATGTSGNTVTDADNSTQKNLGLEVSESGLIGGILRVAKSVLTKTVQSLNFTGGDSMFGTGWQLTDNDGNGNSRLVVDNLIVRMKAVYNELEVRKLVTMAGNYVFSPVASIIEEVDYIGLDENDNEVVLGYEYVKVPWVLRLIPISLVGKMLSRKKMVRSSVEDIDFSEVVKYRCWLRSDDGTTRTINTWSVGMLARCQTYDMASGSGTHTGTMNSKSVSNKLYWRAVTGIGEAKDKTNYNLDNHILEDGLKHNYIDLANYTDENNVQLYLTGSDNPEALDNIVCYGDWLDRTLSNLISIETVGSEAPCIREMLEVGYTNGQSIDWSLTNKERTRISPTAGNKFVAPSFVVTTEGSADESLYVERYKGTAFKTQFVQGQEVAMAPDGSIVLLAYSDIEAQNALKTLHINPPSVDNPAYGFVWKSSKARLGDAYVCQADGHRYVATKTGWEDRGLNDESSSTLKVDINGITSRVSSAEGNISQLQQTAAGLVSVVSQNTVARNILNGVLTGTGWKSGVWNNGTFTPSGDITVDQDGWFAKNAQEDNCFALEGVSLAAESYMLSVCCAAVSDTGTPVVDYPSISCYLKKSSEPISITTNSGAERRECTAAIQITEALSGNYTLYVVASKIRFPQLEKGTSVTDFDAPVLEQTTSLISQMGNDISMSIINKLGETGIDIDGNKRSIELRGDIVTFTNSDGSVSGMVTIDPDTGALHATNAVVTGITATNATITGLSATNATIVGLTATNAVVSGSFSTEQGFNKVIIDAATGGIEMYGPDTLEVGTESALTLRMGWGLSDLSDGTCGIIEVFEAQHQNIKTTIVPGEIEINGTRIRSYDLRCPSGQITFEDLICRRLTVTTVDSDWYDANTSDSIIVSDYNEGITINLPNPFTSSGKFFFIKHKKDKATYLRCTTAEERGYNAIMNDDSESTDWQRNIQNNSTLVFCDGYNWILMELDY